MNFNELNKSYSSSLGISDPKDTVVYKLDSTMPNLDWKGYKQNPAYRHLYDKLFIIQSQHLEGGELSELKEKDVKFPIFIKPRYGHKTSSSKNCYKIKHRQELEQHYSKKNMIWSEFIDATEGMTDFILVNGEIVYQLTYIYSDKQYGFADVWKYISSESQPPHEIISWVQKNCAGYTGPINVQYRSTKIIEIGLRFARGGMYIESTQHKPLMDAINHLWKTKTWIQREEIIIRPFYSFKCWSSIPVLCLLPHHVLSFILSSHGAMDFYEYYFEPTGTSSTVFFQFLHHDFEEGMRLKKMIEIGLSIVNTFFILSTILLTLSLIFQIKCPWLWYVWLGLFLSSMINSLEIIRKQYVNQSQFFK